MKSIHRDDNNRFNPDGEGWVVRSWIELTDNPDSYIQFWQNGTPGAGKQYWEDSGAGTYADDFADDSDEKEEWLRRFGGLIDIRSHVFRCVVDGLVFDKTSPTRPAAQVRIEAIVDRGADTNGDGVPETRVLETRYLTP